MIYILGRVLRDSKLAGFLCADIKIEAISDTKKALEPQFKMLSLSDTILATTYTAKQLVEKGKTPDFAKQFNKKTIDNLSIVDGILTSESSSVFPTLDFRTRDILPLTPRGILLNEYINHDTGKRIGFCLALYNKEKGVFDVGRTNTSSLISYMSQADAQGYSLLSNAQLSIDEDTGELIIQEQNQGYPKMEVLHYTSEDTIKKLSKIQAKEVSKTGAISKKALGATTSTMVKNIAEAAIEITQEQDLFQNFTPTQVLLIQRYYMEYTRQIFESLKRTARIDVSPEKLAKLNMYRISPDYKWYYKGMVLGRRKGVYRCALGHALSRAHVAECEDVTDENGKPLALYFGSTCVADFFQLDSGDIPVLSKAESVMIKEVGIIVEAINNNKVQELWNGVGLLRHFVEVLDKKQSTDGTNSLEKVVGSSTASMLRLFIQENIPFPKSLTEMVLINMKYSKLSAPDYRVVMTSYISRRKPDRKKNPEDATIFNKIATKEQMILFKEYLGETTYSLIDKHIPLAHNVYDFIIASKLQGEYGWDPENRSTGFRGMHNEKMRSKYAYLDIICKTSFGFTDYSAQDFINFTALIQSYLDYGEPIRNISEDVLAKFPERYKLQCLLDEVFNSIKYNPKQDYALLNCVIRAFPLESWGLHSRSESQTTYLNLAMTMEDTSGSGLRLLSGMDLEAPVRTILQNYYCARAVRAQQGKSADPLIQTTLKLFADTTYCTEFISKTLSSLQSRLKTPAIPTNDQISDVKEALSDLKSKLAKRDSVEFNSLKNYTENGFTLMTSTAKINISYNVVDNTTDIKLMARENISIVGVRGNTQGTIDIVPSKLKFLVAPENMTLDHIPVFGLAGDDKQLFTLRYLDNSTSEFTLHLSTGDVKVVYRRDSFANNTPQENMNYLKQKLCTGIDTYDESRISVALSVKEDLSIAQLETLELVGTQIFYPDLLEYKLKNLRIQLQIKDDPEVVNSDTLKYSVDVAVTTDTGVELKKFNVPTLYSREVGELQLIVDYSDLPRAIKIGTSGGVAPYITLKFNGDYLGIHEASYTVPMLTINCRDFLPKEPDTNKGTKRRTGSSVYTLTNPPEEYDTTNPLHAIINAYSQLGEGFNTKSTDEVNAILAKDKRYEVLAKDEKDIIQKDLAYLVSVGKADISGFSLPFTLNTFETRASNPARFKELGAKHKVLQQHFETLLPAEQKAVNILSTVLKLNKLTLRQKPYVEKAEELYLKLTEDLESQVTTTSTTSPQKKSWGEMTYKEQVADIEERFNSHEAKGYRQSFNNKASEYNGKPFEVLSRLTEDDERLENLPAWYIEFEDGTVEVAKPEHIIEQ